MTNKRFYAVIAMVLLCGASIVSTLWLAMGVADWRSNPLWLVAPFISAMICGALIPRI